MATTRPSTKEKPEFGTRFPGSGPRPHEDLTIKEHLETMCREEKKRRGEQCFITEDGGQHHIDEDQLTRFLREYGALHPSDYQSKYGTAWQDDLFITEE